MDMPSTAILLAVELTDTGPDLIDPIVVGVFGACLVKRGLWRPRTNSAARGFDPSRH
ncbi:hypothetical protein L284_22375 [Novosphingobium lindaniclasticum LE124]|uniref:Uncharacterized protein n=2 Tax=Novosphingobium TaxID=165696 RepID=T0H3S7_9SPHN|nr:hypothetical protein L284_22375 [Novosphingobium lindaniclasticum LE124]